jgi:multiple sugar transport system substrate-binding protein
MAPTNAKPMITLERSGAAIPAPDRFCDIGAVRHPTGGSARTASEPERAHRTGRVICLVLAVWLCLLPLTGCKGSPEQRKAVVFAVGGAPAEVRVWEEIARQFSREQGVAVRILRQPTDTAQRRQELLVALGSQQRDPDVFLMDIAWLGLFAHAGWLAPLGNVDLGPFYARIVQQADRFAGKLVALPVSLDVGVLYYRKDLLHEAPPRSWQALAAAALRIQRRMRPSHPGFFGFVWQGAQYEGLVVNFLDFAGSRGGFVFKGNRVRVDSPQNVAALARMADFIHGVGISPPNTYTEMKEEDVRRFFQSGDALFERNWPYAYALHQARGSPVRGKTGVSRLPGPVHGRSAATLGGWHVGVSAFSDVPVAARRFALYLTSREVQRKLVMQLGLPPGRRDLYTDPQVLAVYPHYRILAEVLRTARPRPMLPNYTLISAILQRRLSGALAGDYPPARALALAQREIDALMARTAASHPPEETSP